MDYVFTLMRGNHYQINDNIIINHPTLNEIWEFGEQRYYTMINSIVKTPSDCMWQLDELGIDYEEIDEFDFFAMTASSLHIEDTKIIFGDLDFTSFEAGRNTLNDELVLFNKDGVVIDRAIYQKMTDFIREMHHITKNTVHAGNAITKKVLIEEQRDEYLRSEDSDYKPLLPDLIMALTNCSDFKYSFYDIWDLPIYIFTSSAIRTQKQLQYNNLMTGVYSGNVDVSKINKSELKWI